MIYRKKSLGQHFLVNSSVLEREAEIVGCNGKIVLEIGPGDGRLSERIVASGAKKVYLVEKDKRFVDFLKRKFSQEVKVHIIEGDFLELNPFSVDVIVGNLPYYISSAITFRLAEWKFERAVLMYQSEFAEKMVAEGKERSRLSFFVQHYFEVKKHFVVPSSAFRPIPKVDSMLVELVPKKNVERIDERTHAIITFLFQHRLKMLGASLKLLSKESRIDPQTLSVLCSKFDCTKRIFQLSNDEILRIGKEIARL